MSQINLAAVALRCQNVKDITILVRTFSELTEKLYSNLKGPNGEALTHQQRVEILEIHPIMVLMGHKVKQFLTSDHDYLRASRICERMLEDAESAKRFCALVETTETIDAGRNQQLVPAT